MPRIDTFSPYRAWTQTKHLQALFSEQYIDRYAEPRDQQRYGGPFLSSLLHVLADVERNRTHRGIIFRDSPIAGTAPAGLVRIETAPALPPALSYLEGRATRIGYWSTYGSGLLYDRHRNPQHKIAEDLLSLALRHTVEDPIQAAIAADQFATLTSDLTMLARPLPYSLEPIDEQWVIAEIIESDNTRAGLKHVLPKELAEYEHAGNTVQVYGTPVSAA